MPELKGKIDGLSLRVPTFDASVVDLVVNIDREVTVEDVLKGGKIVLQKWGRVKGFMRVGDRPSPDETVRLQKWQSGYVDQNEQRSMLSFFL